MQVDYRTLRLRKKNMNAGNGEDENIKHPEMEKRFGWISPGDDFFADFVRQRIR